MPWSLANLWPGFATARVASLAFPCFECSLVGPSFGPLCALPKEINQAPPILPRRPALLSILFPQIPSEIIAQPAPEACVILRSTSAFGKRMPRPPRSPCSGKSPCHSSISGILGHLGSLVRALLGALAADGGFVGDLSRS